MSSLLAGLSREEKAERLRVLYEAGFSGNGLARMFGMSKSYVYALLNDSDGSREKARKRRYHGVCVDCGVATYNGGSKVSPKRCSECQGRHARKVRLRWDKETITAKIQEWAVLHGEPPKAEDWLRSTGTDELGRRYWPSVNSMQREFGSWSNALEAAGFTRRRKFMQTEEWRRKWIPVKRWTREAIVQAIRDWANEHGGVVPGCRDLANPSHTTVRSEFGTWNTAIRAAGLTPRPRGWPKDAASRRRPKDLVH